MKTLESIPELLALDARDSLIRIPGEQDIPVTPRIRQLIDSGPFRRLASISQLGLVSLVYPGATHSRFEHSLGVYRTTLLFLKRLLTVPRFRETVQPRDAELLIVAALLHDVGHWPYCHPIEDMGLPDIPDHEVLARRRMIDSEIPEILSRHFDFGADEVMDLLEGNAKSAATGILCSILSGPVDVDKMDYLYRDSLHSGVPYGMHYDRSRLIGSLCLDSPGTSLAITEKGTTAAELMVFARYVMFSEVYWHHTVRSATAMAQRAFYRLRDQLDMPRLFETVDAGFHSAILDSAVDSDAEPLLQGLFGPHRRLYKRLAQFTVQEHRQLFEHCSRKPFPWLVHCSENLAELIMQESGVAIGPDDILIDAPPAELEVQFNISVRSKNGVYRSIDEVSPVVNTLARDQFDNYVKRVRIFASPSCGDLSNAGLDMANLLSRAIEITPPVSNP